MTADPAILGLADQIRALPVEDRGALIDTLSPDELYALLYDFYGVWARPTQIPPPKPWDTWLLLGGRGAGKTRTGAEWVKARARAFPGSRGIFVGRTAGEVRDVMVTGEAGILAISPPDFRPKYETTKRLLTWPNGTQALLFSADAPDEIRGQTADWAWCEELASWRRCQEAWDMLQFCMRGGADPCTVVTTTPKRVKTLREIMALPETRITRSITYDNIANLAAAFIRTIVRPYEGTRLGLQELYAEVLDDNPDALWQYGRHIEPFRRPTPDRFRRIVVAVDPEASSLEDAAETGIIVAGLGLDNEGYVLGDYTIQGTPARWAARVVKAYHSFEADLIVGEVNNGGEMVEHTVRTADPTVAFRAVHASRGKIVRAEPVAMLYEQGRVHHCGVFPDLEAQLIQWFPGERSPDRLDALVWAFTELMVGAGKGRGRRPSAGAGTPAPRAPLPGHLGLPTPLPTASSTPYAAADHLEAQIADLRARAAPFLGE